MRMYHPCINQRANAKKVITDQSRYCHYFQSPSKDNLQKNLQFLRQI